MLVYIGFGLSFADFVGILVFYDGIESWFLSFDFMTYYLMYYIALEFGSFCGTEYRTDWFLEEPNRQKVRFRF